MRLCGHRSQALPSVKQAGFLRPQQIWQAARGSTHLGGVLVISCGRRALARQGQQLAANRVGGRCKAVTQICSHLREHTLH